jgi:hypothetical protein
MGLALFWFAMAVSAQVAPGVATAGRPRQQAVWSVGADFAGVATGCGRLEIATACRQHGSIPDSGARPAIKLDTCHVDPALRPLTLAAWARDRSLHPLDLSPVPLEPARRSCGKVLTGLDKMPGFGAGMFWNAEKRK